MIYKISPCRRFPTLKSLSRKYIVDMLVTHGCIHFTEFNASQTDFEFLTQQISENFLIHGNPGRTTHSDDGKTKSVTPGKGYSELHGEMTYFPNPPEVIWLYCARAPQKGGETTVCDGSLLLTLLDSEFREIFQNTKIVYHHRTPEKFINDYFHETKKNRIIKLIDSLENGKFIDYKNGLYIWEFSQSAVRTDNTFTKKVFVHSIFTDLKENFFHKKIGQSTIDNRIMSHLSKISRKCEEAIKWRNGDILLINNRTWMHGRRPFDDLNRLVLVRLGYLQKD